MMEKIWEMIFLFIHTTHLVVKASILWTKKGKREPSLIEHFSQFSVTIFNIFSFFNQNPLTKQAGKMICNKFMQGLGKNLFQTTWFFSYPTHFKNIIWENKQTTKVN